MKASRTAVGPTTRGGLTAAALVLSAAVALAGDARPAAGQRVAQGGGRAVEPSFTLVRVGPGGAGVTLGVDIPAGWRLYAVDPGDAGRPLSLRWTSGERRSFHVPLRWPEARAVESAAGPVRVHEGRVSATGPLPIDAANLEVILTVEWALCRDDLCVPGESRVTLPRRGRPGLPQSRPRPSTR